MDPSLFEALPGVSCGTNRDFDIPGMSLQAARHLLGGVADRLRDDPLAAEVLNRLEWPIGLAMGHDPLRQDRSHPGKLLQLRHVGPVGRDLLLNCICRE